MVQVAAGNEHTLVLTEGGDLYSSGYNEVQSMAMAPAMPASSSPAGGPAVSSSGNNNTNSLGGNGNPSGTANGGQNTGGPVVKTGHFRLIEKLRGKNVVKIFASNGCEHAIALTSMIHE